MMAESMLGKLGEGGIEVGEGGMELLVREGRKHQLSRIL